MMDDTAVSQGSPARRRAWFVVSSLFDATTVTYEPLLPMRPLRAGVEASSNPTGRRPLAPGEPQRLKWCSSTPSAGLLRGETVRFGKVVDGTNWSTIQ